MSGYSDSWGSPKFMDNMTPYLSGEALKPIPPGVTWPSEDYEKGGVIQPWADPIPAVAASLASIPAMGLMGAARMLPGAIAANFLPDVMAGRAEEALKDHPILRTVVPLGLSVAGGMMTDAAIRKASPMINKAYQGSRLMGSERGIFGGVNAQNADLAAMRQAIRMQEAGIDPREIWSKTGWMQGDDGLMRFEIPDDTSVYKPRDQWDEEDALRLNNPKQYKKIDRYSRMLEVDKTPIQRQNEAKAKREAGLLENYNTPPAYLQHPGLYDNYDSLAKMDYREVPGLADRGGYTGYQDGKNIRVSRDVPYFERRAIAIHELQHAVQDREGFAKGGAPSNKEYNKLEYRDPFETYQRLHGEAEARLAEKRMNYTPEQRRAIYPYDDLDVPRDELIIMDGNGLMASATPPEPQMEPQNIIHYSPEQLDILTPTGPDMMRPYSRNDVGGRFDAATEQIPASKRGYFYLPGNRGENNVTTGSTPYIGRIPEGIADFRTGASPNLMSKAQEMMANDTAGFPSQQRLSNAYDLAMKGAGLKGGVFGPAGYSFTDIPVQGPISINGFMSDVVDNNGKLANNLPELSKIANERYPHMVNDILDVLKKRYPEIKLFGNNEQLARFGDATSGAMEYSTALDMKGPYDSISAALSDAVGLGKLQNGVMLVGENQFSPNATLAHRIRAKLGSFDLGNIEKKLANYGINDYNLVKGKDGYVLDLVVDESNESLQNAVGKMSSSVEIIPVYSETIGSYSGNAKPIYEGKIKHHFGETAGGRIINEAIDRGKAHRTRY